MQQRPDMRFLTLSVHMNTAGYAGSTFDIYTWRIRYSSTRRQIRCDQSELGDPTRYEYCQHNLPPDVSEKPDTSKLFFLYIRLHITL